MSVTLTLGVKITYNLNDTPQLRLARHVPVPVTIYTSSSSEDCDAGASIPPSGNATNKYDGCFAELPLRACLSALKDASPELISNPSFDYSVYVNDPTESSASAADTGVLVGKGLLSSCLRDNAPPSLVFGKLVKDGIRGQSVLVHFVLEKTPRRVQELTTPAPIPPTPSPVQSLLPQQQQHSDPNINALLSFLSSASSSIPQASLIQLQQQPTPDISQLFSALAGCYGLSTFPNPAILAPAPPTLPTPSPEVIIIKEEEDEIVEIVVAPPTPVSTEQGAQRIKRTSLGKENVPPVANVPITTVRPNHPRNSLPAASTPNPPLPPSTNTMQGQPHPRTHSTKAAMSKSKSTSALPPHMHSLCDPSTTTVSRNQTPFLEVPALQPISKLTNGVPTTIILSGTASQKKGKELPGPHGNGWYRRTDLPPMTSSDAVVPPPSSSSSVLQAIVADANVVKGKGKKKRSSDASGDGTAPKKKAKKSRDVVEAAPATSPAKATPASGMNALGGLGARVMAATSPIKPTVVKKITLRHSGSTSKATDAAGEKDKMKKNGEVDEEDKKRHAPVTGIRTLNFLSLAAPRAPTTSKTSGATFAVPLPLSEPITSATTATNAKVQTPPLATRISSLPLVASGLALPNSLLSNEDALELPPRPKTPPPSAKRSPAPPRTPSRRKTPKMDLDEDGDSPLFLDSPVKAESTQATAAPSSPTPMPKSRISSHRRHLSLEDHNIPANTHSKTDGNAGLEAEGPANLSMFDFSDLPPSSPPASFPSSSPSVSPRFTLDSVMDGMDEDAAAEERMDPDADVDEDVATQETQKTVIASLTANEPSSMYSDATNATWSSSTMSAASDCGTATTANANVDLDWSLLADMLGMCEDTKATAAAPMPIPDESTSMLDFLNALGIVGATNGVEQKPMELAGSDIFDFAAFNGGHDDSARVVTGGVAGGGVYEDDGFLSFVTSFGGGTT
ncbi:hypothetical protein FRB94_000303 [Tulasnella sp. JGI-2019a]|nr:hypothetical protein FRB93_003208 [Tulasnella sp. JGI-2019a]KAG9006892.1 hypothetical protein FRB94_000303 [Tulasnella sp. JGI-2019a]KAG9032213.1 hypothetical protein FRB95_001692 [Tulasnella sp. JGI-2019a]